MSNPVSLPGPGPIPCHPDMGEPTFCCWMGGADPGIGCGCAKCTGGKEPPPGSSCTDGPWVAKCETHIGEWPKLHANPSHDPPCEDWCPFPSEGRGEWRPFYGASPKVVIDRAQDLFRIFLPTLRG